jgi:hypothetical protein
MSLVDFIHLLEAITGLIVVLAVVFVFRGQVTALLNGIDELTFLGVKAKIRMVLNESAEQATPTLTPSKGELNRAVKVADLTKQDINLIRQQVDALAIEYDNTRALMTSADNKTRELEKIVSKMRTVGQAAYGIRYELMASPSPGRRLQAVACLQVQPDFELLSWLANRVQEESSFVIYHVLIALIVAIHHADARNHLNEIEAAARKSADGVPKSGDRANAYSALQEGIAKLRKN